MDDSFGGRASWKQRSRWRAPIGMIGVLVAAALTWAALAFAASDGESDGSIVDAAANPDSAVAEALRELEGEPLALDDAVVGALERSASVGEAGAAMLGAHHAVRRERGVFDPELFAAFERSSVEDPSANPLAGAGVVTNQSSTTRAGARMKLPFGTDLALIFDTRRQRTNSSFDVLLPEVRAGGLIEVRQPLLKGFGPATRQDLTAAESRFESARSSYVDQVLGVRAEVESTYWELYAAERDYAVAQVLATAAVRFLQQAELRSGAGLTGPNEVANARAFLAQQQLLEIDQAERLDTISDRLASLMRRRPAVGMPRFRAADAPDTFSVAPEEGLVARAVEQNYSLLAARRSIAAIEASRRGARWDAYPTLDLVGTLGASGLSGSARDSVVIFGSDTLRVDVDGGAGDAWSQVGDFDFPAWSVGVELSVPLGFRQGRGERDRLGAEVERAEQQLVLLSQDIENAVRDNHRRLVNGSRRLTVARAGVEASLEQVRIGSIEYTHGRTTAFELVRLGTDLASAQQRFSQALVRTAKAAAELRRLTADGFEETDAFIAGELEPQEGVDR